MAVRYHTPKRVSLLAHYLPTYIFKPNIYYIHEFHDYLFYADRICHSTAFRVARVYYTLTRCEVGSNINASSPGTVTTFTRLAASHREGRTSGTGRPRTESAASLACQVIRTVTQYADSIYPMRFYRCQDIKPLL